MPACRLSTALVRPVFAQPIDQFVGNPPAALRESNESKESVFVCCYVTWQATAQSFSGQVGDHRSDAGTATLRKLLGSEQVILIDTD